MQSVEEAVSQKGPSLTCQRDELITEFTPLIKYLARKITMRLPANVMAEDLVTAGTLGLMGAIERFDPEKGVQFGTYAELRIKWAMQDELRNMDWMPRSVREKSNFLKKGAERVQNRLGRVATDEEISSELGIGIEEYGRIADDARTRVVSIEDLMGDGDDQTPWDVFADPKAEDPAERLEVEETKAMLSSAISKLPEKEKIVVSLYYYEELTMKQIGRVMSLTESRVSQLHSQAISRLELKMKNAV